MRAVVWREVPLLALTAIPPAFTAVLVFAGTGNALKFIEAQLIAGTVFAIGSFGVSVTLSSLPLPAPLRPERAMLVVPSIVFLLLALIDTSVFDGGFISALLMAALMYVSSLYRIPGSLYASRGLLLAQFLPLIGFAGVWCLAALVVGAHAHLFRLGVYRRNADEAVRWRGLAGAWVMSAIKDFFFRGHYLALAALGLAGPQYASLLRFLDLVSRPTDYLFQRLVDRGQLSGRLVTLVWMAFPVMLISLILSRYVGGVAPLSVTDGTLIGIASGLMFVVKYLSYEQNSLLRHSNLSLIYVIGMVGALPMLKFTNTVMFPILFSVTALTVSLALLLFLGIASPKQRNK